MSVVIVRRALSWSHLWLGLVGGLVFTLLAVSGAVVTFRPQLALWMAQPPLSGPCRTIDWDQAQRDMEAASGSGINRFYAPPAGDSRYHVRMRTATDAVYTHVIYDSCSGRVLGTVPLEWMDWVVDFHHNFLAGRNGRAYVGVAGAGLFLSGLGGLLLLLVTRPALLRLFEVRLRGNSLRAAFDLHRSIGAISAALLLLQTFTGLWLCFPQPLRSSFALVLPFAADTRAPRGPRSDAPPAGLGALMAAAQRAIPDGDIREIRMPEGAGNVQVRMHRPNDFRSLGNNVVQLDRVSAAPLAVDLYDGKPAGNRFAEAMSALHYAEWGGLTYRTVYGLLGLAVLPLFATGVTYWWLRTRATARTATRSAARATVIRQT